MAVARDRSGSLNPIEARESAKRRRRDGIMPEEFFAIEPEPYAQNRKDDRNRHKYEPACEKGCRLASDYLGRVFTDGGTPVPSISADDPGIQLGSHRINRATLVVQMPMDRHPLSLLPALDGRDVAVEIGGNLFPRVQPRF